MGDSANGGSGGIENWVLPHGVPVLGKSNPTEQQRTWTQIPPPASTLKDNLNITVSKIKFNFLFTEVLVKNFKFLLGSPISM